MSYGGPRPGIGRLDQLVTIERDAALDDGRAGRVANWVPVAERLPAQVRPLSGRERAQADRLVAEGGYEVTIRSRGDLDETMRVRWLDRGRVMNIRFVEDHGPRAGYIRLDCETGVAT